MKYRSLLFLTSSLIASLQSVNVYASTDVYSQAPIGVPAYTSAVLNATSDPGFNWTSDSDSQAWDYFNVSSTVSFNRISWYGSKADGQFAVDLFSATCFSCGATSVSGGGTFAHTATAYNSLTLLPNTGPFGEAQVHQSLISGNLYSYYLDLSSSVTLDQNKTYALSVVNNYTSSAFLWAGAGAGTHLDYVVGRASFLPAPNALAFTLTDTSVSPVPEPETWGMMLMGFGFISVVARRRNKSKTGNKINEYQTIVI